MIHSILRKKALLLLTVLNLFIFHGYSQCGLDIYIANDQSGSVDARENLQSRQFIEQLALTFPLGNNNTESRIAISSWSSTGEFQQYNFPAAGSGYTTQLSDIINYRNSPKTYNGYTDPYYALLRAWQNINLTPVPGRTTPRVIILMTDAYPYQVNPGAVALAAQIKATGVRIVVMGIDAASGNPPQNILQGIASPGMNFSASSYDILAGNAVSMVQSVLAVVCPSAPAPIDLSVNINSFQCASGQVNYSVLNSGYDPFGPATLSVSFYNGNPVTNTATLVATHTQTGITIAPGTQAAYSYTNPLLTGINNLYAVVNISTSGNNAIPPLPYDITSRLLVTGEGNGLNNMSGVFNATGCSMAVLNVTNTGNIGCNNIANYQVQVCNTGSAHASLQSITRMQPAGFTLLNTQVQTSGSGCNTPLLNTQRRWGTYFGGANAETLQDVAVDAQGNIYITGYTSSTTNIASAGTFDNTFNGVLDGFVAKFSPAGVFLWGTYIGGANGDVPQSMAIDPNGDIYVAGYTESTTGIASAGAYQTALAGNNDAFLIKLSGANGTRLWGTYYGDPSTSANENAAKLAISGTDVYLAMKTSTGTNNLTTNGRTRTGGADIVLVKFNSAGTRTWATIFGGAGDEEIINGALAADNSAVYLGGSTLSPTGIASGNFWDNGYRGSTDGMLVKFDAANGNVTWGTYVDNVTLHNNVIAICIEAGNTILLGAAGTGSGLTNNTRIYRMSSAGGAPSAFAAAPSMVDLAIDAAGQIYAFGSTTVATGLATPGAYQTTYGNFIDNYFAIYNNSLILQYRSYYGGIGSERSSMSEGITVDVNGNIIIAGTTGGSTTNALATPGAHKTTPGNANDHGYIAKFSTYSYTGTLAPGCCILFNYTYDASAATNGTHHSSVDVTASKVLVTDDDPVIRPDNNFSVPGYTGTFNGFDGAVSSTDDITKTSSPCATPASPITVAVSFSGTGSCSQSFGQATVSITNPNPGITLSNASLLLNLSGTGSVFSGEPYTISNGLQLQSPNIANPNYPAPGVTGQLSGYTGNQTLTIYSLPPGTSSFNIDVLLGTAATNLSATVQNLSTYYNATGSSNTATGSGYTAPSGTPAVLINCPGSINAGATINLSGNTSGATSIQWSSLSNNNITNTGTIAAPQAAYTPSGVELAAGYVDFSLRAINASGCDNAAVCRILINNVQRDFGDAPISFDLGTMQQPIAAASTKLTGLYLGAIDPDMESTAQPSVACNGDGNDEEGLRYYPATVAGQSNLEFDVEITNNSSTQGYLIAYIDWNEDGDFLDADEQSTTVTIPSLTGTAIYRPSFSIPFATGSITTYVRLRLSSDAEAIRVPYGASPEGEVEDHVIDITILPVDLINFKATASGKQVLLSWQTATETNNDHFDIERSANGSGWQKIGTMNGYGNSSQLQTYSFTDYHPYDKSNYYRLRQVNSDGSFSYSSIRQINFESEDIIVSVYPNPVTDQLYINYKRNGMTYGATIINTSGQEVMRKSNVTSGFSFSMMHLSKGMYVIKLLANGQQPIYYKVVKQ